MDECADPDLESSRRVIYGQSEGYVVLVDLSKGPQDLSGTCMTLVGANGKMSLPSEFQTFGILYYFDKDSNKLESLCYFA